MRWVETEAGFSSDSCGKLRLCTMLNTYSGLQNIRAFRGLSEIGACGDLPLERFEWEHLSTPFWGLGPFTFAGTNHVYFRNRHGVTQRSGLKKNVLGAFFLVRFLKYSKFRLNNYFGYQLFSKSVLDAMRRPNPKSLVARPGAHRLLPPSRKLDL